MRPSVFTASLRVIHYFDLPVVMVEGRVIESILNSVFDRAFRIHRAFAPTVLS